MYCTLFNEITASKCVSVVQGIFRSNISGYFFPAFGGMGLSPRGYFSVIVKMDANTLSTKDAYLATALLMHLHLLCGNNVKHCAAKPKKRGGYSRIMLSVIIIPNIIFTGMDALERRNKTTMKSGVRMIIHRGLIGIAETAKTNRDVARVHKVMDLRWQPFSIILQITNVASITAVENKESVV
jgi:hypothetical protein